MNLHFWSRATYTDPAGTVHLLGSPCCGAPLRDDADEDGPHADCAMCTCCEAIYAPEAVDALRTALEDRDAGIVDYVAALVAWAGVDAVSEQREVA